MKRRFITMAVIALVIGCASADSRPTANSLGQAAVSRASSNGTIAKIMADQRATMQMLLGPQ